MSLLKAKQRLRGGENRKLNRQVGLHPDQGEGRVAKRTLCWEPQSCPRCNCPYPPQLVPGNMGLRAQVVFPLHTLMAGPPNSLWGSGGEIWGSAYVGGGGLHPRMPPWNPPQTLALSWGQDSITSPPPAPSLSSVTTETPPLRSPLRMTQDQIQELEQERPSQKKKKKMISVCLSLVQYLNACH